MTEGRIRACARAPAADRVNVRAHFHSPSTLFSYPFTNNNLTTTPTPTHPTPHTPQRSCRLRERTDSVRPQPEGGARDQAKRAGQDQVQEFRRARLRHHFRHRSAVQHDPGGDPGQGACRRRHLQQGRRPDLLPGRAPKRKAQLRV